jgi:GNAT superfamily N-acetyltransferase
VPKFEEYSAIEALRDGCRVEIRALRPDDRADLIAAVGRTSDWSLYRRFFGLKRSFTDQEAAFFVKVDFVNHLASVALIDEKGRSVIAGGGRYIVVQRGQAEVAFVVVDEYQGRGIGGALMRISRVLLVRPGSGPSSQRYCPKTLPCYSCSRRVVSH